MATIKKILGVSLEDLEAMNDAQLREHFAPMLAAQEMKKATPKAKSGKGVIDLEAGGSIRKQRRPSSTQAMAADLIKQAEAMGIAIPSILKPH